MIILVAQHDNNNNNLRVDKSYWRPRYYELKGHYDDNDNNTRLRNLNLYLFQIWVVLLIRNLISNDILRPGEVSHEYSGGPTRQQQQQQLTSW